MRYINSSSPQPPVPCTRTRSPPPRVPGVAGTNLHQQPKAWQPYSHTSGKPQRNEVAHHSARHAAATRYDLYYTGNGHYCGSKSTYHFYLMRFCFCILAPLIPEDIREAHPCYRVLPIKHSQVIQVQVSLQQCLLHRNTKEKERVLSF